MGRNGTADILLLKLEKESSLKAVSNKTGYYKRLRWKMNFATAQKRGVKGALSAEILIAQTNRW